MPGASQGSEPFHSSTRTPLLAHAACRARHLRRADCGGRLRRTHALQEERHRARRSRRAPLRSAPVWALVGDRLRRYRRRGRLSPLLLHPHLPRIGAVVLAAILVNSESSGACWSPTPTGQRTNRLIGAADRIFDSLRNAVVWLLVAGAAVAAGLRGHPAAVGEERWDRHRRARSRACTPLVLRIVVGVATVLIVVFVRVSLGGGLARQFGVAAAVIIGLTWLGREREGPAGVPKCLEAPSRAAAAQRLPDEGHRRSLRGRHDCSG